MADTGIQQADIKLFSARGKKSIYDLSIEELEGLVTGWGEPRYRARQIMHWLYKEFVSDFSQMSNLPSSLRARLAEALELEAAEIVAQKISTDGWTRKALLRLHDGNTVEAVLMLYYDRATVCVSSQVGCAMGCSFCATGQMGFTRNLTAGEIVQQVVLFNRWLREHPHQPLPDRAARARYTGAAANQVHTSVDDSWHTSVDGDGGSSPQPISAITNIVFMGMGEPFLNYNHLMRAIRTINSPQGIGLGARRMTVSTVGIAPQIRRFAREDVGVNLAVSLHAPNDDLRSQMVPMNRKYPVAELMDACRDYLEVTRRRITFEYVLINGVNDELEHARQLAGILKGMLCHVNLIPLNPVPGTEMRATPKEQVFAFQKIVEDAGISTTVRIERGSDIAAACGQLKVEEENAARRRSLNPEIVQAHVQANLAATQ